MTTTAMPLLSPSESYAFQSFLDHIDYQDAVNTAAPEWSMYVNGVQDEHVQHSADGIPHREGTEQLTKATKDLMSLDTNPLKWNHSADQDMPAPNANAHLRPTPHPVGTRHVHSSYPYYTRGSPLLHPHDYSSLTVMPGSTFDINSVSSVSSSSPSPSIQTSASRSVPPIAIPSSVSPNAPSPIAGPSSVPSPGSGASSVSANGMQMQPLQKRHRHSPPHQTGPILNSKQTLLTPSQKKANHIQSEQKRRANIRRGYEALCETVPALREAIRAEEALAASEGDKAGKTKKKGRRKSMNEAGEKVDGRAGPKSENVVLQKTIDYIHDLISERSTLQQRLDRARSLLPPGHPATLPLSNEAPVLWEREWTGGTGILDDIGEDGDADSDDEEDS